MRNSSVIPAVAIVLVLTGCWAKSGPVAVPANRARPVSSSQWSDVYSPTSGGDVARLRHDMPVNVNVATVGHPCEMSGGVASFKGPIPVYPRATQAGFGPDGLNNGGLVIELVTDDSFDRVSDWYRAKMPPGSERRDCGGRPEPVMPHMPRSALFSVGKLGTDYRAAWILELPKDEPNARMGGWPKGKPLPNTIVMLKVR